MKIPGRNPFHESLHLAAGYENTLPAEGFEVRPLDEMERMYIEAVISTFGGNIPRAARALAVSPSTLYRKMARWQAVDSKTGPL